MKRALVAIITAIVVIIIMAIETNAESMYIENSFEFGSYAPTVVIHHPVYNWVLEVKPNGELGWAKPVEGKWSQMFVVLPTKYDNYYSIREFNNGTTEQRYIGYTGSGFKLVSNKKADPATIAYRFVWKKTDSCGGKALNNVWRLSCKKNKMSMCIGGWGSFKIEQTNAG